MVHGSILLIMENIFKNMLWIHNKFFLLFLFLIIFVFFSDRIIGNRVKLKSVSNESNVSHTQIQVSN